MEKFNPHDEKYKKSEDLPEGQQQNFVDVEGGGFIKKEAAEKYQEAENIAIIANSARYTSVKNQLRIAQEGAYFEDISSERKQKHIAEIQAKLKEVLETKISAVDILNKEGFSYKEKEIVRINSKDSFLNGTYNLKNASEELREDKDVILHAVKTSHWQPDDFQLIPEKFQNDKEVMEVVIQKFPKLFEYASEEIRSDREIALISMKSPYAAENFRFLPESLKNEKEFVFLAMKHGEKAGWIISQTSSELQNDADVVELSILTQNFSLDGIPEKFRNDKEFMLEMMKKVYDRFRYESTHKEELYENLPEELRIDKDIIMEFIHWGDSNIRNIPADALKNKEIVLEILKTIGPFHSDPGFPEEIMGNRDIMLEIVKLNPNALFYASKELREDKGFILEAMKLTNGKALRFSSNELHEDLNLIAMACSLDPTYWNVIPPKIKKRIGSHLTLDDLEYLS